MTKFATPPVQTAPGGHDQHPVAFLNIPTLHDDGLEHVIIPVKSRLTVLPFDGYCPIGQVVG
jgi:hypothetical protein